MSRDNAQRAQSAPKAAEATGAGAVRESKRARVQQEALRVTDGEDDTARLSTRSVRKVGGKTFYLRDDVWTDSEFNPDARLPETTLTFGSDAYFALLKDKRKLAEFFALGERIIVVFEGRVYRVNAAAP